MNASFTTRPDQLLVFTTDFDGVFYLLVIVMLSTMRNFTNLIFPILILILGETTVWTQEFKVDNVLDRYAATVDTLRGKRFVLKTVTILSGDTRPAKFVFEKSELDLITDNNRFKSIRTSNFYNLNTSKLGDAKVTEIHCDLSKKIEFPRASPTSKHIRANPLTINIKARGFGDILYQVDQTTPAIYGYLDAGSGLSILEVFQKYRPQTVERITLNGQSLVRLTTKSKWGTTTGYFDPQHGYRLYQYELVKSSDSLLVEANNTPGADKDFKVKDQKPVKSHPIYPSGTETGLSYKMIVEKTGEWNGKPYISEFTLIERHSYSNGLHYVFTHRTTVENVTEAKPSQFEIETNVPDGTYVYVHDKRDSGIEYEWNAGEVIKSSDNTFLNNVKARFTNGGWWSWGLVALIGIAVSAGAVLIFLRYRRRFQAGT